MAGEAKTNAFLLASATVMIGTPANLYSLNPSAHSIGLVKNFTISATPAFTDLTQGVKNEIVYSVMTGNPISATMEAYEYTGKNLSYGLGLDGSTIAPITTSALLKTAVTGDGTIATIVLAAASDLSSQFPVGKWIYAQDVGGTDLVHVATILTSTYTSGTSSQSLVLSQPVPNGATFNVGAKVSVVNRINVGSTATAPFFSAKVVGILPEGNEPITLLIPKLRIIKGFSLAFGAGAFGNMPFEFKPMDLVPTDTFYSDFVGQGPVALMARQ